MRLVVAALVIAACALAACSGTPPAPAPPQQQAALLSARPVRTPTAVCWLGRLSGLTKPS
jgi:hypothetical protein